jgi:hypothetical protein
MDTPSDTTDELRIVVITDASVIFLPAERTVTVVSFFENKVSWENATKGSNIIKNKNGLIII